MKQVRKKSKTGQKLWKKAKKIIPGGSMLFSKRSEMFLPENWPSYYSKAKGCNVWDLDGNKYVDISLMGVGTNILGYSNKDVDNAVIANIKKSNMSTLNNPEEVKLAEKLIDIHKWPEMVRYARTGGEAAAIAIRVARAATGKNKIAFCGYHGWHDWYLSANLSNNKNLEGHLIPGISTKGVPNFNKNQVYPFNYNKIDELKKILSNNKIAAIIMEVSRNIMPNNNFLIKVKQLAKKNNAILIFDECTSGFRENYGGLHLKYKVNPDIALFGKAIGNGYAITAVIGRRSVMDYAQKSFISSTFWTERSGPTAALKTLEIMKRIRSWEKLIESGNFIKKGWNEIFKNHGLKIEIIGRPCLLSFKFNSKNNLAYKTYITQELFKDGYLASNSVYLCINHNEKVIEKYLKKLNVISENISRFENGLNIFDFLDGPICQSDFKRFN